MAVNTEMIKQLRELTGAGVLDCKKALDETGGDLEKASEILKRKGLAVAAKKAEREANNGVIGSYVHAGNRVAALVEVNCETDFVARTEDFRTLAHDLAMQVVAAKPSYVGIENIPPEVLEARKKEYLEDGAVQGKPAEVVDRIVEGKLRKYYQQACLLEQPYIKDDSRMVGRLIQDYIAKLGENIVVKQFARMEIEDTPSC